MRRLGVVAALAAALLCASSALAAPTWRECVDAAKAFAAGRAGTVYFFLTTQSGRHFGYYGRRVAPSASVLKAMLLVAYLHRPSVRHRDLTDAERSLLGPMIRRSSNTAANQVITTLGPRQVNRLARRVGMEHFVLHLPIWGLSEITARDQAYFFRNIDGYVPRHHRRYAMRLLASIVPSQRWGIPPVKPDGWNIYFKGGWGSGTGRVTHQVALLRRDRIRISLAVLTQWNPSQLYGERTIRGVARRLFRGL